MKLDKPIRLTINTVELAQYLHDFLGWDIDDEGDVPISLLRAVCDFPGGKDALLYHAKSIDADTLKLYEKLQEGLGKHVGKDISGPRPTICDFKWKATKAGMVVGCGRLWKKSALLMVYRGDVKAVEISNTRISKTDDGDFYFYRQSGNSEEISAASFKKMIDACK